MPWQYELKEQYYVRMYKGLAFIYMAIDVLSITVRKPFAYQLEAKASKGTHQVL